MQNVFELLCFSVVEKTLKGEALWSSMPGVALHCDG